MVKFTLKAEGTVYIYMLYAGINIYRLSKFDTTTGPSLHDDITMHAQVADLLCYSRGSGDDLLQLLLSQNLISWRKKQQIHCKLLQYQSHTVYTHTTIGIESSIKYTLGNQGYCTVIQSLYMQTLRVS